MSVIHEMRIEELERALRFYADPKRYNGSNQRVDKPDEYQPPDMPYLLDVSRDGGTIARKALEGK